MGLKATIAALAERVRSFIVANPKLTILVLLAGIGIVVIVSVQALHMTSSPAFCRYCHPKESGIGGEVASWEKSKHAQAKVSCLDCHAKPGLLNYFVTKVASLRDVYGEFMKDEKHKMHVLTQAGDSVYAADLVRNETCLFCHTDAANQKTRSERIMTLLGHEFRKLDGVKNPDFRKSVGLPDILTEGVRSTTDVDPKHGKHFDMGLNCVDCHLKIAHSGIVGYKSNMETCFTCHDKMREKQKNPPKNENCIACHRKADRVTPEKPITFGKGANAVNFSHKTHTAVAQCGICHNGLFQMKAGSTKIGFADHGTDKACFPCHNGKKATDWSNCKHCHTGMTGPKPVTFGKGDTAVRFKHETHTAKAKCGDCHTKVFPMKSGATRVAFADHGKDKACFICHNGKKASDWSNCTKCHAKVPMPKDITYKPSDAAPVKFSHDFHGSAFECKECHTKIWPMKRGGPMKMDPMYEGKLCGVCHSEKGGAFAATDCDKCHVEAKK
ncbi:MAG TPA: c(7)-type cytochrome triheme domain-containing protein [Dissulfurispiraceae bacterium]|nr:c(7)-type cytochrome triheme domain-containing protein [Dissulfurispiraceae bacterium]